MAVILKMNLKKAEQFVMPDIFGEKVILIFLNWNG
jgi:hypothetical protein